MKDVKRVGSSSRELRPKIKRYRFYYKGDEDTLKVSEWKNNRIQCVVVKARTSEICTGK